MLLNRASLAPLTNYQYYLHSASQPPGQAVPDLEFPFRRVGCIETWAICFLLLRGR
jgi:hypothetical protein